MTIVTTPHEMLIKSAELINERGQNYGTIENNFQLIADLFSLRAGREFHPWEVCVLLECVKDARMFANPTNIDNYLDGINYKAFAALFAEDYINSKAATSEVSYKKKTDFRKSEMNPVEVSAKNNVSKLKLPTATGAASAAVDVDALSDELLRNS